MTKHVTESESADAATHSDAPSLDGIDAQPDDESGASMGTFDALWHETVKVHGDRTFLVFSSSSGAPDAWTYAEFEARVASVSDTLRLLGVGPGRCVYIALANSPAFVAVWLATARLGAWMVPVDPASSVRDISRHLTRVSPTVAVVAKDRAGSFHSASSDRACHVIEVDELASDLQPGSALVDGSDHSHERVDGPRTPASTDRLAVMFTSGTTAEPKGVVLTQANYVVVATEMAAASGLTSTDRWLVSLPLFHANAQYYCFAPAIAVGASVALTAKFSASRWVDQARELEATHASLFAAPIRMILARTPTNTSPIRLRHVWFAQSLGAEHHEQFAELVGTRPRQLYGMTETIAAVTVDRSEPSRHDAIGRPLHGRLVRLTSLTGPDEGPRPGEHGEIQVSGQPGVDLFLGYLNAPEIDAMVLVDDGGRVWFRTGDLARLDGDDLVFVGRTDDVIKVAGENVSLSEVEAAAAQAPGILEVAVVGEADPVRDTVPIAYFVASEATAPPSAEDLDRWAVANLAPAARPRHWHQLDELPRTSVGKIRRFRMQAAQPVVQST